VILLAIKKVIENYQNVLKRSHDYELLSTATNIQDKAIHILDRFLLFQLIEVLKGPLSLTSNNYDVFVLLRKVTRLNGDI
jgi:hypothetical protein